VDDTDRALLLAAAAVRLDDSFEARASLLASLARNPALIGSRRDTGLLTTVDVSPDGHLVSGGETGLSLYTADLAEVARLDQQVSKAAFAPDGRQVAIAAADVFDPSPVRLLDTSTFDDAAVRLGGLPQPPVDVGDLDYSDDGRYLAVSLSWPVNNTPSAVWVWDLATPEQPVHRVDMGPASSWAIALSRDGGRLYRLWSQEVPESERSLPPTLTVYDVATDEQMDTRRLSADSLHRASIKRFGDLLEISPDGTLLAVGDAQDVKLLDSATLATRQTLHLGSETVQALQFSHDGRLLAAGSTSGGIHEWDVATGNYREPELNDGAGAVAALGFSPDDGVVYSASRELASWDLRGDRRFIALSTESGLAEPVSSKTVPAPDGRSVAYFGTTSGTQDTIRFRDLANDRIGLPLMTGRGTTIPTWRPPEWQQVATANDTGEVAVWDWRRNELITRHTVAREPTGAIAYGVDGQRLFVGGRAGTLIQVDAETLQLEERTARARRSNPADPSCPRRAHRDRPARGGYVRACGPRRTPHRRSGRSRRPSIVARPFARRRTARRRRRDGRDRPRRRSNRRVATSTDGSSRELGAAGRLLVRRHHRRQRRQRRTHSPVGPWDRGSARHRDTRTAQRVGGRRIPARQPQSRSRQPRRHRLHMGHEARTVDRLRLRGRGTKPHRSRMARRLPRPRLPPDMPAGLIPMT
jgi:WD40 repeat protein